jgi:hypothetical protein
LINRAAGLVLPWSTKYLIDDVVGKKQLDLLLPLAGVVASCGDYPGCYFVCTGFRYSAFRRSV